MGLLELWLITAPLWAILCALIAQSKGLNVGGWVLWGILLGVIGVVMVSVAPNRNPAEGIYGPDERDADLLS